MSIAHKYEVVSPASLSAQAMNGSDPIMDLLSGRFRPELTSDILGDCNWIADRQKALFGTADSSPATLGLLKSIAERISGVVESSQDLRPHLFSDPYWVNAFAIPDGRVFIWPKLLSKLTTVDEIAALLAHEYVHILRGHSVQLLDELKNKPPSKGLALSITGAKRSAEVEADILGAATILSKAGFNPLAMANVLKAIDGNSTTRGWDVAHGATVDRVLNVYQLVPTIHLQGSDREMEPLPEGVRDELKTLVETKSPVFENKSEILSRVPLTSHKASHVESLCNFLAEHSEYSSPYHEEMIDEVIRCVVSLSESLDSELDKIVAKHKSAGILIRQKVFSDLKNNATIKKESEALSSLWQNFEGYLIRRLADQGVSPSKSVITWLTASVFESESEVDFLSPRVGKGSPLIEIIGAKSSSGVLAHKELVDSLIDDQNPRTNLGGLVDAFNDDIMRHLPRLYIGQHRPNISRIVIWANRNTDILLGEDGELDLGKSIELIERLARLQRGHDTQDGGDEDKRFSIRDEVDILQDLVSEEGVSLEDLLKETDLSNLREDGSLALCLEIESAAVPPSESGFAPPEVFEKLGEKILGAPLEIQTELFMSLMSGARAAGTIPHIRAIGPSVIRFLNTRGTSIGADFASLLRSNCNLETKTEFCDAFLDCIYSLAVDASDVPKFVEIQCEIIRALIRWYPSDSLIDKYKLDQVDNADIPKFSVLLESESLDHRKLPISDIEATKKILREIHEDRFGGDTSRFLDKGSDFDLVCCHLIDDYLRDIEGMESIDDKFERLSNFSNEFSFTIAELVQEMTNRIDGVPDFFYKVTELLNTLSPHLNSPERVLAVLPLIQNADVRLQLSLFVSTEIGREMDYESLSALILNGRNRSIPLFSPATKRLTEELANTGSQLDEVSTRVLELSCTGLNQEWGKFTLLDGLMEKGNYDSADLLLGMLESKFDESRLYRSLARHWWNGIGRTFQESLSATTNYVDEKYVEEWAGESLEQLYRGISGDPNERLSPRDTINRLYECSDASKSLIVRKLLTGPGGILHDRDKTKQLIKEFIEVYVDLNPRYRAQVYAVVNHLVDNATFEELYFRFSPFLTRSILQRPEKPTDSRQIISDLDLVEDSLALLNDENQTDPIYVEAAKKRLLKIMAGESSTNQDSIKEEHIPSRRDEIAARNRLERGFLELIPDSLRSQGLERLSGVDALRQALSLEGQVGARLSQLIPQFFELPSDLAPAFEGVYDQQPGQSKLEAYRACTVLAPGLVGPRDKMQPLVGSGSLATVYPFVKFGDNTKRALKVLNPNAKVRIEEAFVLWNRIFESLETDPNFAPSSVRFFREQLLHQIKDWMIADVSDDAYLTNDERFRSKWNGERIGRARLIVPKSETVEAALGDEVPDSLVANRHIKLDEFIEGRNLSELTVGSKTDIPSGEISIHDYREVLRLLVTNYVEQILDGMVHSNPHPGNYRVLNVRGEKNEIQVAVLDRNLFLHFTELEIGSFRRGVKGLNGSLEQRICEAVLDADENSGIPKADKEQILKDLSGSRLLKLADLNEFSRSLRERGVVVPLRYSLLLTGVNAFDKMCQEAGFENGAIDAIDRGYLMKRFIFG